MKSKFHQVALIGKYQTMGAGTQAPSSRAALQEIAHFLHTQGCEVVLETHNDLNFSLPQHCYEYCNTLGWFYDTFEHPQRLKLLYSAASFLNRDAWHQRDIGEGRAYPAELPSGAERMSQPQLLGYRRPVFWLDWWQYVDIDDSLRKTR